MPRYGTKPAQMRLTEADKVPLDVIRDRYALGSLTEAVRAAGVLGAAWPKTAGEKILRKSGLRG